MTPLPTPDPSWPPHIVAAFAYAGAGLDVARLAVVAVVLGLGLILALLAALLIATAYRP